MLINRFLKGKNIYILLVLVFLLGSLLGFIFHDKAKELVLNEDKKIKEIYPASTVFLLDWEDSTDGVAQLMEMDINGDNLQRIDYVSGTIGLNREGTLIATGCRDRTEICIYDIGKFSNQTIYPPILSFGGAEKELSLPKQCTSINNGEIGSISWSNDSQNFIIVCENKITSIVCFVGLDSKSNCWETTTGDQLISRADWSPNSDVIVIDQGEGGRITHLADPLSFEVTSKVLLVDRKGNLKKELTSGWSPSWSPNGKEIAFITWDDERGYAGIASIRPDGTGFRWLYRPPQRGSGT
jgi:Tol biopolymer transport system component